MFGPEDDSVAVPLFAKSFTCRKDCQDGKTLFTLSGKASVFYFELSQISVLKEKEFFMHRIKRVSLNYCVPENVPAETLALLEEYSRLNKVKIK